MPEYSEIAEDLFDLYVDFMIAESDRKEIAFVVPDHDNWAFWKAVSTLEDASRKVHIVPGAPGFNAQIRLSVINACAGAVLPPVHRMSYVSPSS